MAESTNEDLALILENTSHPSEQFLNSLDLALGKTDNTGIELTLNDFKGDTFFGDLYEYIININDYEERKQVISQILNYYRKEQETIQEKIQEQTEQKKQRKKSKGSIPAPKKKVPSQSQESKEEKKLHTVAEKEVKKQLGDENRVKVKANQKIEAQKAEDDKMRRMIQTLLKYKDNEAKFNSLLQIYKDTTEIKFLTSLQDLEYKNKITLIEQYLGQPEHYDIFYGRWYRKKAVHEKEQEIIEEREEQEKMQKTLAKKGRIPVPDIYVSYNETKMRSELIQVLTKLSGSSEDIKNLPILDFIFFLDDAVKKIVPDYEDIQERKILAEIVLKLDRSKQAKRKKKLREKLLEENSSLSSSELNEKISEEMEKRKNEWIDKMEEEYNPKEMLTAYASQDGVNMFKVVQILLFNILINLRKSQIPSELDRREAPQDDAPRISPHMILPKIMGLLQKYTKSDEKRDEEKVKPIQLEEKPIDIRMYLKNQEKDGREERKDAEYCKKLAFLDLRSLNAIQTNFEEKTEIDTAQNIIICKLVRYSGVPREKYTKFVQENGINDLVQLYLKQFSFPVVMDAKKSNNFMKNFKPAFDKLKKARIKIPSNILDSPIKTVLFIESRASIGKKDVTDYVTIGLGDEISFTMMVFRYLRKYLHFLSYNITKKLSEILTDLADREYVYKLDMINNSEIRDYLIKYHLERSDRNVRSHILSILERTGEEGEIDFYMEKIQGIPSKQEILNQYLARLVAFLSNPASKHIVEKWESGLYDIPYFLTMLQHEDEQIRDIEGINEYITDYRKFLDVIRGLREHPNPEVFEEFSSMEEKQEKVCVNPEILASEKGKNIVFYKHGKDIHCVPVTEIFNAIQNENFESKTINGAFPKEALDYYGKILVIPSEPREEKGKDEEKVKEYLVINRNFLTDQKIWSIVMNTLQDITSDRIRDVEILPEESSETQEEKSPIGDASASKENPVDLLIEQMKRKRQRKTRGEKASFGFNDSSEKSISDSSGVNSGVPPSENLEIKSSPDQHLPCLQCQSDSGMVKSVTFYNEDPKIVSFCSVDCMDKYTFRKSNKNK